MRKLLLAIFLVFITLCHIDAQVYGEPVVTWDFSDGIPANWSQGVISTTNQAHWEYRGPNTTPNTSIGARGSCSILAQPISSVTQSNGFILFDSNYWDDMGNNCGSGFGTGLDPAPHNAWIITNPIDFTDISGLVLTFQQQYRHYQATTKVQISNDNGQTWNDIIQNTDAQSNISEWKSANISAYANNQSNVRLKFIFIGTYYWWLIDDITIFHPNDDDLMITNKSYTNNTGSESANALFNLEYDQYPSNMIPPFKFKSTAYNVGSNNETSVQMNTRIVKDGTTEVYNTSSASQTVNASATANFAIQDEYTNSADLGDYKIYYTISQTETDATPSNNIDSLDYSITAHAYAKDEGAMENSYTPIPFYDTYLMEGGNFFEGFQSNIYCHSLQVGVAAGTQPGSTVRGVIYNQSLQNVLATTETYTINEADLNAVGEENMFILHLPAPFALHDDSLYFVALSEIDSTQDLRIARSGKSFGESSLIRYPSVNATFVSAKSFLIRMNMYPLSAITGCTDQGAMNYNPAANTNDGSCRYPGCTNELADNYDPETNFDDGTCIVGGCLDPNAANFDPTVNYDNGNCHYPGCTDPVALNYNPQFNIEDGSCSYLHTYVEVSNLSGCPPLTISIQNNNIITENSACLYQLNDNSINTACESAFEYTINEPGEYDLHYTISIGNSVADTIVHVSVFEIPDQPVLTYNGIGAGISCSNCGSNQYTWFFENTPVAGSDNIDLNIVQDDVNQNGHYSLLTTNANGCTANSEVLTVLQPYFTSSQTEGCVPLPVTFTDLTDIIPGMTCSLNQDNGNVVDDFSGAVEVTYTEPGSYAVELTCTDGTVSNTYSVTVQVNQAISPILVNNETSGLIECTNFDQFEEVIWNVDGTISNGGNSQPDGGNNYGITGITTGGCNASSLLIVAGVNDMEEFGLSIFPNPASNELHVASSQSAFTVELYDITSKRVNIPSHQAAMQQAISVKGLSDGIYLLNIHTDAKTISRLVQVQH